MRSWVGPCTAAVCKRERVSEGGREDVNVPVWLEVGACRSAGRAERKAGGAEDAPPAVTPLAGPGSGRDRGPTRPDLHYFLSGVTAGRQEHRRHCCCCRRWADYYYGLLSQRRAAPPLGGRGRLRPHVLATGPCIAGRRHPRPGGLHGHRLAPHHHCHGNRAAKLLAFVEPKRAQVDFYVGVYYYSHFALSASSAADWGLRWVGGGCVSLHS